MKWGNGRFTTIPLGLIAFLARVQVGRNGLAVIMSLCRCIYDDGSFGRRSCKSICEDTGLTPAQVSRGMAELKEKLVIEPVIVWSGDGSPNPDRSNFGHVARYMFTPEVMQYISDDMATEGS